MKKYYGRRSSNNSYVRTKGSVNRILFMNSVITEIDCWRFTEKYKELNGRYLYQDNACGEGEVVRHLCGDNKCINPIHLVRGSDIENAEDEIEVRDFTIKFLSDMIGENYDNYGKDLAIRILLPRVSRNNELGLNSMSEVANYAREFYRRSYVKRLLKKYENPNNEELLILSYAIRKLKELRNNKSIVIVEGK